MLNYLDCINKGTERHTIKSKKVFILKKRPTHYTSYTCKIDIINVYYISYFCSGFHEIADLVVYNNSVWRRSYFLFPLTFLPYFLTQSLLYSAGMSDSNTVLKYNLQRIEKAIFFGQLAILPNFHLPNSFLWMLIQSDKIQALKMFD